jgi:hypothetical protein
MLPEKGILLMKYEKLILSHKPVTTADRKSKLRVIIC